MSDGAESPTGPITVGLFYEVGQLYVRSRFLGHSLEATPHGLASRVILPSPDGTFPDEGLGLNRSPFTGQRIGEGGPEQLVALAWVHVQVGMGRTLSEIEGDDPERVLVDEADAAGTLVVRALMDWARTAERQVWLPPRHQRPSLGPVLWLADGNGWRSDWHGQARAGVTVLMTDTQVAPMGYPDAIPSDVLSTGVLPTPEDLLAEAQGALWPARDPHPQQAVLLAAIALEVKTPAALRAAASHESRQLVDLLLKSHEEVPTSVRFQLDAVAEAVFGTSLRQHDGRLYKEVKELYRLRNEIAHRGETPSTDEARKVVAAARRTFDWLDATTTSS